MKVVGSIPLFFLSGLGLALLWMKFVKIAESRGWMI